MTILRYDRKALAMDAARGALGLAICVLPLAIVDEPLVFVQVILWGLAAVFAFFLLRTLDRHKTEISLSQDAVEMTAPGRRRRIDWSALEDVRLSFYAGKKSRPEDGVMSLKLKGGGTKIVVESSLSEFDSLAEAVAGLCSRNGIAVDPTTAHNFEALGAPIRRS